MNRIERVIALLFPLVAPPIALAITLTLILASVPAARAATPPAGAAEIVLPQLAPRLGTLPKFQWGSDPFLKRPGFSRLEKKAATPLKLEAIIFNTQRRRALISGNIVSVGSLLPEGERVSEIGANYVVIEYAGGIRELAIEDAQVAAPGTGKAEIKPIGK